MSDQYDAIIIGTGIIGGAIGLELAKRGSRTLNVDKLPAAGYGSTSKMLGESAVCLARDPRTTGGGCWTPASAMGEALLRRLGEHAGVTFELE